MNSQYPEILTLQEASTLLQVSERTLHKLVKKGEVPGAQIGGQWRFDRDQLKALVRGEWSPPPEPKTQRELVESEALRLGVEIPESLLDLQQAAKKRLQDAEDGK